MVKDFESRKALAEFYVKLADYETREEKSPGEPVESLAGITEDFNQIREMWRLFLVLVCELAHNEELISEEDRERLESYAQKIYGRCTMSCLNLV